VIDAEVTSLYWNAEQKLRIGYGNGDVVIVQNGLAGAIEKFEMGDETVSLGQLIGRFDTNDASWRRRA